MMGIREMSSDPSSRVRRLAFTSMEVGVCEVEIRQDSILRGLSLPGLEAVVVQRPVDVLERQLTFPVCRVLLGASDASILVTSSEMVRDESPEERVLRIEGVVADDLPG